MPAFTQRVAEQRLDASSGVQAATTTRFRPFSLMVSEICLAELVAHANSCLLGVDHIGKRLGVFDHRRDVHHPADIGAAMADEDADLGLLLRDVPLRRIYPLPLQACRAGSARSSPHRAPAPLAVKTDSGISMGPWKAPLTKMPGPGGLHRVDRVASCRSRAGSARRRTCPASSLHVGGRVQSDGQDHQIEFLFLDPVVGRGVADRDVLGLRDLLFRSRRSFG